MKKSPTIRKKFITYLTLAITICVFFGIAFLSSERAYALEEPAYSQGEDYYIDEPDAFLEQDPGYDEAQEAQGSTSYWMTCPFYLEWVSDDVTIYEGETAYIGCKATGLNDLTYEWYLSTDGGKWFEKTELVGPEHTLTGLKANTHSDIPYLYRCVITNGDGLSTLATMVSITVLPNPDNEGPLPQTGDSIFIVLIVLGSLCFISLLLLGFDWICASARKPEDSEEDCSYK